MAKHYIFIIKIIIKIAFMLEKSEQQVKTR